jgi:phosphoglucomutase
MEYKSVPQPSEYKGVITMGRKEALEVAHSILESVVQGEEVITLVVGHDSQSHNEICTQKQGS